LFPTLTFLLKEEFLEELKQKENKRHWCEPFEIKDRSSGNTRFKFTFPDNNVEF